MRKVFRTRNFFLLLVSVLLLLIVGDLVAFAYRKNSCGPGDHVLLSTDDDIKQAEIRISRARYGSHGVPGYVDEKPDLVDFGQSRDCSGATRSRNILGVVIWKVYLDGETIGEPKKRHVSA